MRNPHKLSTISGNTIPECIIFVDTETDQFRSEDNKIYHELKLGVAIYSRFRKDTKTPHKETFRFRQVSKFWQFVSSKCLSKKVLYLISHNAVFDFTVLQHMRYLTQLGYDCKFVYEGGVTFIAKWMKSKHTIVILDNSNWFAGKLEKWGKELNLPKLEMPEDTQDENKWFVYCERDCNILYQLFIWYADFLLSNDLGNWKYTIASSALCSYRHRFMVHPIYIPADDDETRLARESYHGGRTECFKVGEFNDGPYYKLDINSMYPYIMRNNEYPTNFDDYVYKPDTSKVRKALERKAIIADVQICTPLPFFVYKQNDRNIYPIGSFRTTLCTEELKLAYDNGWVQYVYSSNIYRKRDIFTDYVDFFYQIKLEATKDGKSLLRAFSKLYLNALYGKFGQRGYVDSVIGTDTESRLRIYHGYNIDTGQRFTMRQVGHSILYSEKRGEGYNSFAAIASHVTANARIYLYELILKAGRNHCYYCDTDSIIVDSVGFERLKGLLHDTNLGWLKIEGISDVITIVAPKHYCFANKWVMKGIRKNAQQIGPNAYIQEIWPGLNSVLKHGSERYYNYFLEKHLSPSIISGVVKPNGTIEPFVLKKER